MFLNKPIGTSIGSKIGKYLVQQYQKYTGNMEPGAFGKAIREGAQKEKGLRRFLYPLKLIADLQRKAAKDKEMHEQTQPLNKLHQNPADELSLAEQAGSRLEGGGGSGRAGEGENEDGQINADTEEGLIKGERRLMKRSQLGR